MFQLSIILLNFTNQIYIGRRKVRRKNRETFFYPIVCFFMYLRKRLEKLFGFWGHARRIMDINGDIKIYRHWHRSTILSSDIEWYSLEWQTVLWKIDRLTIDILKNYDIRVRAGTSFSRNPISAEPIRLMKHPEIVLFSRNEIAKRKGNVNRSTVRRTILTIDRSKTNMFVKSYFHVYVCSI